MKKENKLKLLFIKNGLFLKIITITIIGIASLSILIASIAINISKKAYIDTFCHSDRLTVSQIKNNYQEYFGEVNTLLSTINSSWAVRRYLTNLDLSSVSASNTIFSMNKQIMNSMSKELSNSINVLIVGTNERLYVSKNSTLTRTPSSVLSTPFTEMLSAEKGGTLYDFIDYGYTQIARAEDKQALIIGKALMYDGAEVPYGYTYIIIPQNVLSGFYQSYDNEISKTMLINKNGKVLSATDKSIVGKTFDGLDTSAENALSTIGNEYDTVEINGESFAIVSDKMPENQGNFYIAKTIDTNLVNEVGGTRNTIIILVTLAVSLVVICIMFVLIRKTTGPIYKLSHRMEKISADQLGELIELKGSYETKTLANAYNIMVESISKYVNELVIEQNERRKAEIYALQMQINPHFIYNTLTSIKWLIWQDENDKAIKSIDSFSNLLRNTISNKNEIISTDEEAENLVNYIYLLETRYANRISASVYLPENCKNYEIPKLIIQPFVENAFYHAFGEFDNGYINVFFMIKGNNLIVNIVDNGCGINESTQKSKDDNKKNLFKGIGMNNVDSRIKLLYGNEYGINIKSTLGKGTEITISMPAKPINKNKKE